MGKKREKKAVERFISESLEYAKDRAESAIERRDKRSYDHWASVRSFLNQRRLEYGSEIGDDDGTWFPQYLDGDLFSRLRTASDATLSYVFRID